MRSLNRRDLLDILHGATILGAGGGGDLTDGIRLVDHALERGKPFRLATITEVPDEAIVCTPYMLGAISAMPAEQDQLYANLPRIGTHPILLAYKSFQEHLGVTFHATTACELGGANTAVAFFAAAMNDQLILDADPAGRAVPEITHSTYFLAGLPASPIVAANEFGETFIIDNIKDDRRAETLVRSLCQVSRNDIAAIDHALPMAMLRRVLIRGTISRAMELGKTLRRAIQEGIETGPAIAKAGKGLVGFSGKVESASYRTEAGFTTGQIHIAGVGRWSGSDYTIAVKNENMAGWIDGAVHATVPDLICLFDEKTGYPVANPDVLRGQEVCVVLLPAPEALLSAASLRVFGPEYAGVKAEFRSVTSLVEPDR